MLCLQGVPNFPREPQDEAGLTLASTPDAGVDFEIWGLSFALSQASLWSSSFRPTRISQPEDSRQPNNVIRQPLGPDGSQGFKQRR